MNGLLHNWFFIGICVGLIITIILAVIFWPKKKLCARCEKKKTTETDEQNLPICDDCRKFALLGKVELEEKKLSCPKCGQPMHKHLFEDTRNVIVDICHTCGSILTNRKDIRKITILNLKFFPKLPTQQDGYRHLIITINVFVYGFFNGDAIKNGSIESFYDVEIIVAIQISSGYNEELLG